MALSSKSGNFSSRLSKGNKTKKIKSIDEENHFPFAKVEFVRIGSAHTECDSGKDSDTAQLLSRVVRSLMAIYQPNESPQKIIVEFNDQEAGVARESDYVPEVAESLDPYNFSFCERQLLKLMYLCVLVKGILPDGQRGYCYFGIFAHQFLNHLQTRRIEDAFNPRDIRAIVLARSMGIPSPEIQSFMRMRFSFAEDCSILEVSRP